MGDNMKVLRDKELTGILNDIDEIKELVKLLDKNETELVLRAKILLCLFNIQRKLIGD